MTEVWEHLAEHAELEIGGGGEVIIFAGQMAIHAVAFEYQAAHQRLAWIGTKEGERLLLDVGSIYAVRDLVEGIAPSTWLPS